MTMDVNFHLHRKRVKKEVLVSRDLYENHGVDLFCPFMTTFRPTLGQPTLGPLELPHESSKFCLYINLALGQHLFANQDSGHKLKKEKDCIKPYDIKCIIDCF